MATAFMAGPYVLYKGGVACGLIQDGITIEFTRFTDAIKGDNLGETEQEAIHRGGNCFMDFTLEEYDLATVKSLIWPWHGTFGTHGVAGKLAIGASGPSVSAITLKAMTGSPADGTAHALITATNAILAPNFPVRISFNSRLRRINVRLQLLPFLDTSWYWFKPSTTTAVTYPLTTKFTAGPYTATYGAADLGITEDGFELEFMYHAEEVRGDNLGDTVQDLVYRGGSCFLSATFNEWATAVAALADSYSTGVSPITGVLMGNVAAPLNKSLVLTAVAGTSAAAAPATLTAALSGLAPNYPVRYLMAPRLRRLPVRFQVYPNSSNVWFAVTP